MESGSITGYIDVAQIVLYAFWIFFFGLIFYLRREDKREGYPLESDRSLRSGGRVKVQGFPAVPTPKTFRLPHGGEAYAPRSGVDDRVVNATPAGAYLGAPLDPTGDPMLAGVGPGAYAERADVPDTTAEGLPRIIPLRVAGSAGHALDPRDPNPIGMPVVDASGNEAGRVTDAWIDLGEPHVRYLEVDVPVAGAEARSVLIPIGFARVSGKRGEVVVRSITAAQFANAPVRANPDQVTLREEDRIGAYYGGGTLYALAKRRDPLI